MSDRVGLVIAPGARIPAADAKPPLAGREPDPLKGGDVYQWAIDQVALIRAGRFQEIDWINVADEIDSVGKSEVSSLTSHIEIVLTHMLKWDHQPIRRTRSWVGSIAEHRDRVEKDLSDSPSLKLKLDEAINDGYKFARYVAERETGLSRNEFPGDCPYHWDAIMTRPFVLDQTKADQTDAAS